MVDHEHAEERAQYWRAVFDAFPHPTLIVNAEVEIQDFNTAAEKLLGEEPALALHRRGGEVIHCIHAEANGCGHSRRCQDCVIRNSVRLALAGGAVQRQIHEAELRTPEGTHFIYLLITASLLPYAEPPGVLLVLEDVGEFRALAKSSENGRLHHIRD